jgi:hypothetical protein
MGSNLPAATHRHVQRSHIISGRCTCQRRFCSDCAHVYPGAREEPEGVNGGPVGAQKRKPPLRQGRWSQVGRFDDDRRIDHNISLDIRMSVYLERNPVQKCHLAESPCTATHYSWAVQYIRATLLVLGSAVTEVIMVVAFGRRGEIVSGVGLVNLRGFLVGGDEWVERTVKVLAKPSVRVGDEA